MTPSASLSWANPMSAILDHQPPDRAEQSDRLDIAGTTRDAIDTRVVGGKEYVFIDTAGIAAGTRSRKTWSTT